MNNNFFNKPKTDLSNLSSSFELYNLKENPFPSNPVVNSHSEDNRYNGNIYEESIRIKEMDAVMNGFLRVPQANLNHLRLGYILDTSYVGRGNGKSSFSINLLKKINTNYCLDISDNNNKCFGLYVTPQPSGKTKSFSSLVDLLYEEILDTGIIDYSLAAIRLEHILKVAPEVSDELSILEQVDLLRLLTDEKEFEQKFKKYETDKIFKEYKNNELLKPLPAEFPLFYDRVKFYRSEVCLASKQGFRDYYYGIKKADERVRFFFNDLVNFLLAAGFNGAYALIDDFERIPDFQSDRQKRDFALDLRTNFFDGVNLNAKIGFFNLIMMLHAGVPRLIENAWSDSGMEQRSPISSVGTNVNHVVHFEKLAPKHAVLLIQKYLDEYRINKSDDKLFPFTEDAVILIGEMKEYNAASILQSSYTLLENAKKENCHKIDVAFVNKILGENITIVPEETKVITDEPSVDLFNKAKE